MKLGDLVYYFTKYTGIRYVWKKINPNCNCDKRRKDWNDIKIKRWLNLVKMIILNGKNFVNQNETLPKQSLNYYATCTQNILNIQYTILVPAQSQQ